ncbi:hypothetical protein JL721_9289 [Aureococcus anophagefferens]|nr:hypothetical protein JL721_9289 [Aureococcus anophagefferens]
MWRLLALALLPTTSPFPSSVGCGEALEVGQFWMSSYSVASSLAIEVTDASGGAVACGGTVAEGEALRVAVGGVGSASFNIGVAGATFESGSCGNARSYDSEADLVAPAAGASVTLVAGHASGYGTVYITESCVLTSSAGAAAAPRRAPAPTARRARADAAADARAVRGAGQPDGGAAGADARADGVADVASAEPSAPTGPRRRRGVDDLDGVDVDEFGDDEAAAFEASVADALGLPADDVGVVGVAAAAAAAARRPTTLPASPSTSPSTRARASTPRPRPSTPPSTAAFSTRPCARRRRPSRPPPDRATVVFAGRAVGGGLRLLE